MTDRLQHLHYYKKRLTFISVLYIVSQTQAVDEDILRLLFQGGRFNKSQFRKVMEEYYVNFREQQQGISLEQALPPLKECSVLCWFLDVQDCSSVSLQILKRLHSLVTPIYFLPLLCT